MKINLNSHFPHPVLCDGSDDYLNGHFDLEITEVRESRDGRVELDYTLSLDSTDLEKLTEQGIARPGAFVRCQDTFYSDLLETDPASGTWRFDPGSLYGRVEVKPAVWLTRPVDKWKPESLNPEFGKSVSVRGAEIIGLADDIIFSIGQDKLRKFESIFELRPSDDIPKGRLKLDLMADAIRILAPVDLFNSIELMRGSQGGKPVLLSAVYMPVVMEVLESIRGDGASGYEDRPWYRVFSAKCEHLGIDVERAPLLESAQRLLASPVQKLGNSFTEMMDHV